MLSTVCRDPLGPMGMDMSGYFTAREFWARAEKNLEIGLTFLSLKHNVMPLTGAGEEYGKSGGLIQIEEDASTEATL